MQTMKSGLKFARTLYYYSLAVLCTSSAHQVHFCVNLSSNVTVHNQTRKSGIIRKSNQTSGVCKAQ